MKKSIVVLGLSTFLACGTLFAINNPSERNDPKTELDEGQECEGCVVKADRKNPWNGKDEIQITNNCSGDVIVEYEHWSDTQNKFITVKYNVKAKTTSNWFPAESYRNYKWYWA